MEELRKIASALKQLGVVRMEMQEKGYPAVFRDILKLFGKAGLWEEGLTLIGSWCFNVYVQTLGVEFYPLRTLDFDFGLRVPYAGKKADVDELLRLLGFIPRMDMGYDKVDYELPGVGVVEVFIDREKASAEQREVLKRRLKVRPALLSYLDLLIAHTISVKLRGVHKAIVLPSLPAFFIHKLITAKFGEYRRGPYHEASRIRRDYKQAALVAKRILADTESKKALSDLLQEVPVDFRTKMASGARAAQEYITAPDLTDEDVAYILKTARVSKKASR
jgi:hypothetical protein